MPENRPRGRKVFTTGGGSGVHKTGSTGSGKVGGGGFFSGSGGGSHGGGHSGGSGGSSGGGTRSGGGRGGCLPIIIILAILLFGGGGLAANQLGGDDTSYQNTIQSGSGTYNWGSGDSNTGVLNTRISSDAREKFTTIKGDGTDTSTILVYMCGTDLESHSAMGTSDLNEMISATVGKNINLIVYTGGCKRWRNSAVSSNYNQIWQISGGNIKCLVENAGTASMTKPETLSSFIQWAVKKYPANRTSLIFWDHGGGSVTGYGYDEKYPRSGSMTLSGINTALKTAGVKYDFIGFDACLMATAETALVVGNYADYMIGSEETEPGIGWYYTNWLSRLSADPSLETLQIGKIIADDFTAQCAKRCPGQSTTLSVVDLSELSQTLPDKLNAFADEATNMISGGEYKEVASARTGSKEFARSNGIDQVDLTDFAKRLDTSASKSLAKTLTEAIKYNMTARGTTNAYGLSIYFPYRSLNKVDSITNTYEQIGMDENYTSCIRKFAQMGVAGQAVSGGYTSPFDALMGGGSSGGQDLTSQAMQQLIGSLLGGRVTDFRSLNLEGLDSSNTEFLSEDPLDPEAVAEYIADNHIASADLAWQRNSDGKQVISLTEEQWSIISTVDKTMLLDDGEGYIEMGLDNVFDFDDDGNLLPNLSTTWLSINGQPVAYYHQDTTESDEAYRISGYVPVKLNGEDARLILVFDNENEQGYIAGVSYDYDADTTETQAKNLIGLKAGDQVRFVCDCYDYSGDLDDSYYLGKTWTVDDPANVTISNTEVGDLDATILYKFSDIYGQTYWTKPIKP